MILDGIDYACEFSPKHKYRRPMTQAEKEAGTVATVDPLVSQVVDAIKTGGWNRDLATRIIAMVREHDAGVKHLHGKFARLNAIEHENKDGANG